MPKSKSKSKNLLKKIFPNYYSSSKKSKAPCEHSENKTIVQCTNLEKKEIADICLPIECGNSCENEPQSENGTCSSVICKLTLSGEDIQNSCPSISERLSNDNNIQPSEIDCCNDSPYLLTIPTNSQIVRKCSDCDSAVDMKYSQDREERSHSNKSKTSGYTSMSLGPTDESINKAIEDLKIKGNSSEMKRNDSSSSWSKVRAALMWIPFIQQCSKHQYPWIQIAGHQGNFKPGDQGTVLKKHCSRESICLQMMNESNLEDFVPRFKSDVFYEDEKYICMQDLLAQFHLPSLMDIKMGTRTYLEEELTKAKCSPKPRKDMYEKMIAVDKDEPTEEEHNLCAVIKPRYMQWRETLSSTLLLGFRIEGIKKSVGTQSRDYKRTRDRQEVKESLRDFIDNDPDLPKKFIQRLQCLQRNLEDSTFFWEHEFIGSSLLFVHDSTGKANIWMIDFGKTIPLPPKFKIDHISPWIEGNHEDGYLFGLENLLTLLQEIHSEILNNSR